MYPKYHIVLAAIFAVLLYFLFTFIGFFEAIIIFLAGSVIDIDHYFTYIIEKKDLNFIKSVKWCKRTSHLYTNLKKEKAKKVRVPICWFHGLEFLIILIVLSFFSNIFLFILIGVVFHLFLDYSYSFYKFVKYPNRAKIRHPFISTHYFIKTRNLPILEDVRRRR